MSSFAAAMHEAETRQKPDERIDDIKRAVADGIQAIDPAVSVHFTEYFNHLAVPDMVLRWKNESSERRLFVRPSADPSWIAEDIVLLDAQKPVIFTLEDPLDPGQNGNPSASEAPASRLADAAIEANTWVTGPAAADVVADARKSSAVVSLLGQALVRGGRGIATERGVRELTRSTEQAFDDAARANTAPLGDSVVLLQSALDEQQAGRFTRILRAVWEGHGGSQSGFPGATATGPLNDDDLTYLLKSLPDAPEEFWRRVGRGVSTMQLGRLGVDDPSTSLQRFVRANLHEFGAKALRVTARQMRLEEAEDFPRWLVDRGCLAIRGASWIAHIAARRLEELPPVDDAAAVTLDELKRTLDRAASVTRLDFGKGDRTLSYESKDRLSVLDDQDLETLGVVGLLVEQVALALPGGGMANVDFRSRTAQGPTNSSLPLAALARVVMPLLIRLESDEAEQLNRLLPESSPGLFASGAPEKLPVEE